MKVIATMLLSVALASSGAHVPRDYRKAIDLYMVAASHNVEGAKEKADKVRKGAGIGMR